DEAIVGRVDEDLHVHSPTVLVEVVVDHTAHIEVAKIHGRTDFQRADVVRLEVEGASWSVVGDLRRLLQTDKGPLLRQAVVSLGRGRIDGDIHARQQGAEPGDAAQRQAWSHHPETRPFARQIGGVPRDVGGDGDTAPVLTQPDTAND